jgi:AcrR family transcriptional regulator
VRSKKLDRRVARTRRSLSKALIELIQEKRFDSITVLDVIDRADVGKEDLFLAAWKGLLDWLVSQIEWEKASEGRFMPVLALFQHAQKMHPFYRALARSRKTDFIFNTGLDYLIERVQQALISFLAGKPQPSVPVPVLANYLAGEILGLLRWWLEHDRPYTPERMDEIFHELVRPGFRSVLGQ